VLNQTAKKTARLAETGRRWLAFSGTAAPARIDAAGPSFAPSNRDEEHRHKGEQKYNGAYIFGVHGIMRNGSFQAAVGKLIPASSDAHRPLE
jgi:hypothetical protein